jgi:MFS family permease
MLLIVGIFFYTENRFGFSLTQNLLLACGQGAVYVVGSLSANRLQKKLGRRRLLVFDYALMALLAGCASLARSPGAVVGILLTYTAVVGTSWPALESLVAGDDREAMARKLSIYNVVWASAGAIAIAVNGTLIVHWPAGVFLVPVMTHALSCGLMMVRGGIATRAGTSYPSPQPSPLRGEGAGVRGEGVKLALVLSRISLPATYVVIYSLMAMLPSMPGIKALGTSAGTAVCSVWMAVRCLAFLALGLTHWWHSRPRLLLVAGFGMLIGFVGTVGPATQLGHLGWIIAAQILLGAAMGIIYSGSLYFGMVLSDGSTEHGGYHEALIGLGQVLGPGASAAAAYAWPGNAMAGVIVVATIITGSIVAAQVACVKLGKPRG